MTSINNAGAGSLRQAIVDTPAGGAITFDPALNGQTILLGGTELLVNKNLTIDASALANGITISGNNASRVFSIAAGANVVLDSLTITKGNAGSDTGAIGGGILNTNSFLTLRNSTLAENIAGRGAAVYSTTPGTSGKTTIVNTTMTLNSASFSGGAIHNNFGSTEILNSTITGNSAPAGEGGGVVSYGASDTITEVYSSIISGNSSSDVDLFTTSNFNSFVSLGYNVIGNGEGTLLSGYTSPHAFIEPGDVTGITDPMLAPLGNFGGPTQTMPPSLNSPALDAGTTLDPGGTDQRGAPRFANGAVDIGAVELIWEVVTTVTDEILDPGTGLSLREAIAKANVDVIIFDPALNGQTILLGGTELLINKNLTIDASALANGITISGNNASRVFRILNTPGVTLSSLTITGGNAVDGGGIRAEGNLTVVNSIFVGNVSSRGGGIWSAQFPGSSTLVDNCTFVNNSATIAGGAFFNNIGLAKIYHSTITGNSAPPNEGGGVSSWGLSNTETEVYSSIISGNSSSDVDLFNSNFNSFASLGYNLIGNGEGILLSGFVSPHAFIEPGDMTGITNPMLAPLGNFGGPTQTMPPLIGSPVIDAGPPESIRPEGLDQRGAPGLFNGVTDIGSVESLHIETSPTTNSSNQELNQVFVYTTVDGSTNEIYIGTDAENLDFAGNSSTGSYALNVPLANDTQYYWQIGTLVGDRTFYSEILSFNTRSPLSVNGVNSILDENDGFQEGGISLRDAIADAIADEVITFDPALNAQTILLDGIELLINKNLTIDASALANGITISGNNASRVFNIAAGANVVLDSLTITGGNPGSGDGGGIRTEGSLTLRNSTIVGNSANRGGGLFSSPSIGSLTSISNCTFVNNTGTVAGGAVFNEINTTKIFYSTLTGNSAPSNEGSGVASLGAEDTITEVYSSIISGNDNSDVDLFSSNFNSYVSLGYNLIGNGEGILSSGFASPHAFIEPGDVTGITDPMLAPLANYGGPTQTMPPLIGSPAIDAGTEVDPGGTDQRGAPRLINQAVDLGAVESLHWESTPSNDAINVSPSQTLSWSSVEGALYEVFLGTSSEGLVSQGLTPDNSFSPASVLTPETTFFWQISTIIDGKIYYSQILNFTTRPLFSVSGVNTILDENDGFQEGGISLRDAIADAIADEVITFDPALNGQTILLGGTELLINKNLTIDASALANGITISGNNASRVFRILNTQGVTLSSLTITGGNAVDGGGIRAEGNLTVVNSIFVGNVSSRGGGIWSAQFPGSSTLVDNCTFVNNSATIAGGAFFNNIGLAKIYHSTITGNSALPNEGGGVSSWGLSNTETEVYSSIISGNSSSDVDLFTTSNFNSFVSLGYNLIGNGEGILSSGFASPHAFIEPGDVTGITDPVLAPLGNYGGPTQTMPPLLNSPALDAGVPVDPGGSDQRGATRFANGAGDIGAVEFQPTVVTTTVDEFDSPGTGLSLREAIASEFASTVTFDPSMDGNPILLNAELYINENLVIDGYPHTITVSGNDSTRVFVIEGANVTLNELTISNGKASGAAGILVQSDSIFSLNNSTLKDNDGSGGDGGGIFITESAFSITNSTISGNVANSGGGIFMAGSEAHMPSLLSNCTITGNTAIQQGGGIFNLDVTDIVHCTISGNLAPASKGGGVAGSGGSGSMSISNSIISGNAGGDVDNVGSLEPVFSSSGHNLIGTGTEVASFNGPGDLTLISDPFLEPLGDNGGPTWTMMLRPASPAIDAGPESVASPLTDQRGFERILGSAADIGAYEAAAGSYNADGLTVYAKLDSDLTNPSVVFEISSDPNFYATVSTFSGNGIPGDTNGQRSSAQYLYPSGLAQDANGNIYIADSANHRIQLINTDGEVSTIAGTGTLGFSDGLGFNAMFAYPTGLAVGPNGNLYVADTFNNRIRKLQKPALTGQPWTVTTFAGSNTAGSNTFGYQDGKGSVAKFALPQGIVADRNTGTLYVADSLNHVIRKLTSNGLVSTLSGNGSFGMVDGPGNNAQFHTPIGLALDQDNLLLEADRDNNSIRRIAPDGTTSTLASGLDAPVAVVVDADNNYYVTNNNSNQIVKVTNDGSVTQYIAGSELGEAGYQNGKAVLARFDNPAGMIYDLKGDLLLADTGNHSIRRIIVTPIQIEASIDSIVDSTAYISAVINEEELGLDPSQTYYVRWRSKANDSTQMLGQSFYLVDFPAVTTEPADPLTAITATLNAKVTPNNSPTTLSFKYSTLPDLSGPPRVSTLMDLADAPHGIAAGPSGQLYISSRETHQIHVVSSTGDIITTYGTGQPGYMNGNASVAQFDNPSDVVVIGDFLYVADEYNHCIRRISIATGDVTTFSGSGLAGFADGSAASASFLFPKGISADSAGNIYVADTGNHLIRKIIPSGDVSTLAGSGTSGDGNGPAATAQFNSPEDVAVSGSGLIYVADTGNHSIRLVSASNNVSLIAGNGAAGFQDGTGSQATFDTPAGIAVDAEGYIFIADYGNNRIRRIEPGNVVKTFAGSDKAGFKDSPVDALHPATVTEFDLPANLTVDANGRLFITDKGNMAIRVLTRDDLPVLTVAPVLTGNVEQSRSIQIPEVLLPGGTYYFRAEAMNIRGTGIGETLSFTTPLPLLVIHDGDSITDPQILPDQTSIDFGTTPLNVAVERTFTIENTGGLALDLNDVDIQPVSSGAFVLSVSGLPLSVEPGNTLSFTVTLMSSVAGMFGDDIVVSSDDPNNPEFLFSVEGEVLDPPVIIDLDHDSVTDNEASFSAMVNPSGSETLVAFEYSKYEDMDGVYDVQTLAGSVQGFALGCADDAQFDNPADLAVDLLGNIYIADSMNHVIRKISITGECILLAGTGIAGYADGPGTDAQFNHPQGIAVTDNGIVYVADTQNQRIRRISLAGNVTTVAGLGSASFTDGVGSAARFNNPTGLAVDPEGNLYVADSGNNRIRKINPDNYVSTLAGPADFSSPRDVAVDDAGHVYVADSLNNRIRMISPSAEVFTLPGEFTFTNPTGVAVDAVGNVYVADQNVHRIVQIDANGILASIAGIYATPGDLDGKGSESMFDNPAGVAVGPDGAILVADKGNHRIRRIELAAQHVLAGSGLNGFDPLIVTADISGLEPNTTYYYRVIASNGGGVTYFGTAPPFASFTTTLAEGSPFLLWQEANFGTDSDPDVSGAESDASGDGVPNILKYAFGMDPNAPSLAGLPVIQQANGVLTLTYAKVIGATDIVYEAQASTDLLTWNTNGVTEQILSDDGTIQQVEASVTLSSGEVKFLRLEITFK